MNRPTAPRRVLLAVNEHAHRGKGARARATAALRRAGHEVAVVPCEDGKDALAEAIAASRGKIDAAVIGGGDGTLLSALPGIRKAEVPLSILPLGTVNELARTLEIPFDLDAACRLLDDGRLKPIDIASVNGHAFFNEASIGFSTHVAERQTEAVKARLGVLAVPITTARSLRAMRPYHLEVESDQGVRSFRTVQLTVANSYRFGAVVENAGARLDDGILELYSVDVRNWRDALGVILAVARKRFTEAACVTGLRGTRFIVRSRRPHRVSADGEPVTHTPAEFTVEKRALQVYVPQTGGHA